MSFNALITRRLAAFGLPAVAFLSPRAFASPTKLTARIIVSLADNVNQGIVPTTPTLGDGQSARTNLYWGALYGMKTHFRRHADWTVEKQPTHKPNVLESIKLISKNHADFEIQAEAWDGAKQNLALKAYLRDLGDSADGADLTMFVGHNVLMDSYLGAYPMLSSVAEANKSRQRKTAVIACKSRSYFSALVAPSGVESYVMTNGLMAPEAYVIEGILNAWMTGGDRNEAGREAAKKYAEYQKISLRSAERLFGVKP